MTSAVFAAGVTDPNDQVTGNTKQGTKRTRNHLTTSATTCSRELQSEKRDMLQHTLACAFDNPG